jgi:hypothetical protein
LGSNPNAPIFLLLDKTSYVQVKEMLFRAIFFAAGFIR